MADGRKKYKRTELDGKVTNRLAIVQVFGNILFLILIGYLFCVQVLDLNDYKEKGVAIRTTDNTSVRGNIYDRNGIILATDRIFYEVYAHPDLYSEKYPPEKIATILAPILKMPEAELITLLKSKKINTIVLKKDADRATAQKITKLHLRAISVGALKQRVYPQGSLASHILGYYSHRSENAVGIESIANETLSDVENPMHYERTVNGEVIFDFDTDVKNLITKQRGKDVTLTINSAVQYICDRELEKVIKEKNTDRGAIIITDIKSGEILAYSAYPTFDPNQFWKYPQSYTKNWSLTDVYPPGSTFKVLTVATALELGAINESSKIPDTGRMVIDGHAITNYDYARRPNPGMIDLVYLFEHSSNVGSAVNKLLSGGERRNYKQGNQPVKNPRYNAALLCNTGNFDYGYNVVGDFVPKSAGDSNIEYGRNVVGDFVPKSVNGQNIEYGYNAAGDFVPKYIGGKKVEYGYNVAGDFVPKYIGNEKIEYGYNVLGEFVPKYIGGKKIEYGYNVKGQFVIKEIKD